MSNRGGGRTGGNTSMRGGRINGSGRGVDGGSGRGGRGTQTMSPSVHEVGGRTGGRGGGFGGRVGRGTFIVSPSVHEVGGGSSSSTQPPPTVDSITCGVQGSLTLQEPVPLSDTPPVSSKLHKYPARPGFGTKGARCVVRANHFIVQLAEKDLHHYDISITPEVTSRGVNRAVISQLVELYRESHLGNLQPVYDGRKSLYTAGPLPFEGMDLVVYLPEKDQAKSGPGKTNKDGKGPFPRRERKFNVAIRFASRPDLHHLHQFLIGKQRDSPHEVIQALDVVMRETPTKSYAVVGRSFFSPHFGGKGDIGDGLEVWKGYYQSIRPTQMGISLNIDVSATAFYQSINVVDYVMQMLNLRDPQRPLSNADCAKIKRALKGVRVELTHRNGNRMKICGVTSQPTDQLMFPIEDGTNESVVRYFQQKYNIYLKFPHWPCLQAGSDARPAYLPMEVCAITDGQKYPKKLNEKQVTGMLRAACQRPKVREDNIAKIVRENHYEEDKHAKEFGINVSDMMTTINGARVLPPPMLKYNDSGRDKRIQPRVGQWNMMNARMVNGGKVNHWACLNLSRRTRQDDAHRFFEKLVEMCQIKGVDIDPRAPLIPVRSDQSGQVERALVNLHKEATSKLEKMGGQGNHLQLLIIILPDSTGSYGTIKRVCETELGIVSQCCQPKHASRVNPQYLENVAMKINAKVGGRNTVLEDALMRRLPYVSDCPTIFFGADVTHPPPGEDSSPSIAAVVASMDWPEVTKYRCLVSAQLHRQELISDLHKVQEVDKKLVHGGMIRDHLIAFRRATGFKPHRIIFYRDGVSEGQFAQVLLHEIDAIHKACASLEDGYLPPITFIVVQKRHHTRLFPANHMDRNMTDKSGNILPGTVVDSMICHPTEFDFYLCSHAGIQGTSRPTHYHVLYDENKFTADGLQMLTNNLCYTYARCTRSVSVVPPAYYAHLGAFRARYYIEGEGSDSSSSHGGGGANTRATTVSIRSLPKIKDCVKDVMFYV